MDLGCGRGLVLRVWGRFGIMAWALAFIQGVRFGLEPKLRGRFVTGISVLSGLQAPRPKGLGLLAHLLHRLGPRVSEDFCFKLLGLGVSKFPIIRLQELRFGGCWVTLRVHVPKIVKALTLSASLGPKGITSRPKYLLYGSMDP